jgi:hypothetical protein
VSRSRKKTPIFGNVIADSEAIDKKIWHSRFRHNAKQRLNTETDFDNFVDVDKREASNPYSMNKDGKRFWKFGASKLLKYLRK